MAQQTHGDVRLVDSGNQLRRESSCPILPHHRLISDVFQIGRDHRRIDDALKSAAEVMVFRGGFGGFQHENTTNQMGLGCRKVFGHVQ